MLSWIEDYLKAGNVNAAEEELALLAENENHRIRLRVAENPSASGAILEKLARDSEADVRLAVAGNVSAPADLVLMLAHDDDVTVRHGIAESPDTTFEVLKMLCRDENPYVSCRAAKTLRKLGCHDVAPEPAIFAFKIPQQRFAS